MADDLAVIRDIHDALLDSRSGYQEAVKDDKGEGLAPLFNEMIAMRTRHHAEIDKLLKSKGQSPDESGSFMAAVHRTVIWIRSAVTGLDESILPGLIDGEERIYAKYDEALSSNLPADFVSILKTQQSEVSQKIASMKAMSQS